MLAVTTIAEPAPYVSDDLSASLCWIISNEPIGRPNCSRCFACTSALAMIARAPRDDAAARPSRPELRISSAILNPWPTSPRRFSAGQPPPAEDPGRRLLPLLPPLFFG